MWNLELPRSCDVPEGRGISEYEDRTMSVGIFMKMECSVKKFQVQ